MKNSIKLKAENKELALQFVQKWMTNDMRDFENPRRGRPEKGTRIGFQKEKMEAAHLMAVFPTLQLKEVGKLCNVSEGVLRLWRTQPDFKKTTKNLFAGLSKLLLEAVQKALKRDMSEFPFKSNLLKDEADWLHYLAKVIGCLNVDISVPILKWAGHKLQQEADFFTLIFFHNLMEAGMLAGPGGAKHWENVQVDFVIDAIELSFDHPELLNAEARRGLKELLVVILKNVKKS